MTPDPAGRSDAQRVKEYFDSAVARRCRRLPGITGIRSGIDGEYVWCVVRRTWYDFPHGFRYRCVDLRDDQVEFTAFLMLTDIEEPTYSTLDAYAHARQGIGWSGELNGLHDLPELDAPDALDSPLLCGVDETSPHDDAIAPVHAVSARLGEIGVPDGPARQELLLLVQMWSLVWTLRPAFDAEILASPKGPRVPALEMNDPDAIGPLDSELDAILVSVVEFYRDPAIASADATGEGTPWGVARRGAVDELPPWVMIGDGVSVAVASYVPLATTGVGLDALLPVIELNRLRQFGVRRSLDIERPHPARPAGGIGEPADSATVAQTAARVAIAWRETLEDLADR